MSENELIRIGFEESGVELEDYDMCESCSDAVAVDRHEVIEYAEIVIMKWGSKYGV